jgi:hypothetical protein
VVWSAGEQHVPGSDRRHFCKPAGIAVSRADGVVFVADGYCNSRVSLFILFLILKLRKKISRKYLKTVGYFIFLSLLNCSFELR